MTARRRHVLEDTPGLVQSGPGDFHQGASELLGQRAGRTLLLGDEGRGVGPMAAATPGTVEGLTFAGSTALALLKRETHRIARSYNSQAAVKAAFETDKAFKEGVDRDTKNLAELP